MLYKHLFWVFNKLPADKLHNFLQEPLIFSRTTEMANYILPQQFTVYLHVEIGKQVVFLRLHDKTQTPKYNSALNLSQLESPRKGPCPFGFHFATDVSVVTIKIDL